MNLWTPFNKIRHLFCGSPSDELPCGRADGIEIVTYRRDRRGRPYVQQALRCGPNAVHAMVSHPDGSIDDCGISFNLLTNIGRDVEADWWGGGTPAGGAGSPATAVSTTTLTATGTPWTASNLATPQLGLAGKRIYASVTGVTTPPVWTNIISNTTSVATHDGWKTATDAVGTTPANTNAFLIGPGGIGSVRYMALTTDTAAASASDTTLASEATTNGLGRALATYAHTYGAATLTLSKAFSATGTVSLVHKMAMFSALSSAGADPAILEAVLNADATVVNGDTLTVTSTVTLSG